MRIAYLLTSLGIGGAERQALDLAERMRERGHAVIVVTLRPRLEAEWPTSLPVFRLGLRKNPLSLLVAFVRARRYIRDLHPDVIHSHSFHANLFARLLKPLLRAPAVISTIHNIDEGGRARMLGYRLTDGLSRCTTAVSRAVADRFIALRAVPAGKCTVILNAIDPTVYTPDLARRVVMRDALHANNDFIWLAAGRLTPAKDYPNLLRAFAKARMVRPDSQLWIAGQAAGAQLSALQALVSQLGLGSAVYWLGLRRDIPAVLDAADAFVLSSAWEGMPLVIAEAMAMEKPFVATDAGGVRELAGETAALVPSHNSERLTEAMLALMRQSDELRQAQARAARARIEQNFSIEARCDEWESLYRTLMDPEPAAGDPVQIGK
jgi:glycosyltransferase involved in cell wall biosynthesis